MKLIILFFPFAIIISLIGCKQTTEPTEDILVIYEAESDFQNDFVKVALDKEILLEKRITTDYTISLAWSSGVKSLSREDHILHFEVVEYRVKKDYKIDTKNDTSTVLLRFDKSTKQISIEQIKGRILRD
jgi:hypothetical protein